MVSSGLCVPIHQPQTHLCNLWGNLSEERWAAESPPHCLAGPWWNIKTHSSASKRVLQSCHNKLKWPGSVIMGSMVMYYITNIYIRKFESFKWSVWARHLNLDLVSLFLTPKFDIVTKHLTLFNFGKHMTIKVFLLYELMHFCSKKFKWSACDSSEVLGKVSTCLLVCVAGSGVSFFCWQYEDFLKIFWSQVECCDALVMSRVNSASLQDPARTS